MCIYSTATLSPLNVASPPTPIQSIIVLYNLYIIIAASKAKSSCKIGTFAAEVVEVFQALVHCD